MEEEDYSKLPVLEKCVHKVWKARISGYDEAIKLFRKIDDEKSPEWNKYLGLIKKFVVDSNAPAQEKGLEAALAFVENCSSAGKTVGDVMNGLVLKCVSAPKVRTKELAIQLILKYIELEKQDIVLEELIKGTENKNPKISAACIHIITISLHEFGAKVINVNIILKRILSLLEDRDKSVRDEAKGCLVEMYRWLGPSLKPQLVSLKPSQLAEVETEYENQKHIAVKPLRLLKSQQDKKIKIADIGPQNIITDTESSPCAPEIDSFDYLDPIDILSKLPPNFYTQVEAKKWSERKEALENLDKELSAAPKIESADYLELVKCLKKIIQKDTNVVVVGIAIKCVTGLAKGLRKKFYQYSSLIMPCLFEKFKEKKQNVVSALRDAVDAVYLSTNLEHILEDVINFLDNKNPNIKAEMASFLARCFSVSTSGMLNKKILKPLTEVLLKTLNDQDQLVRDNTAQALGVAMMVAGEKIIGPFLADIDNIKLAKIKECCEKAQGEKRQPNVTDDVPNLTAPKKGLIEEKIVVSKKSPKYPLKKKTADPSNIVENDITMETVGISKGSLKNIEPSKFESNLQSAQPLKKSNSYEKNNSKLTSPLSSVDKDSPKQCTLESQITEQLISELMDKNWKTRSEAVSKLHTMVKEAGTICSDLGEAPVVIAARISDSNSKIAVASVALVESLILGMGSQCKQHTVTFLPPLIKLIGDSKVWIRTAAITCLETLYETGGHKEFFENEILADALKSGSPAIRSELWNFLAIRLPNIPPRTLPKEELMACLPSLFANIEDRNAEVRKSACDAVLGFMIHLGFNSMNTACDNIKASGSNNIKVLLEKTRANVPESLAPLKSKPNATGTSTFTKTKKVVKGIVPKPTKLANSQGNTKSSNQRDKIEADTSPLLPINNLKNQRVIDEQKLKVLKWNFTSPRSEFVELLKELMFSASINRNLISDMFHNDFRYHLRAIDSLAEELSSNDLAPLTCNLDLILRWLTLRFFDTNPSVLLKSLDYLNNAFNLLSNSGYQLLDYEANSFIPYLIVKLGDSKDVVRNNTRSLFKQISTMFPVAKQFTFVMEGVKCKNARQRSECLDHLAWIIENYGMMVCQPNAVCAIKEIAGYIADRDSNVRNAALNCIVTAYFLDGEKVIKMIGHIADKDMSLLEERIKRATKSRPVNAVRPLSRSVSSNKPIDECTTSEVRSREQPQQVETNENTDEDRNHSSCEETVERNSRLRDPRNVTTGDTNSCAKNSTIISGPFFLDPQLIADIEKHSTTVKKSTLVKIDTEFFKEPIVKPSLKPIQVTNITPTLSQFTQKNALKRQILKISDGDIEKAIEAMSQIDMVLNSDKKTNLIGFIDLTVKQLIQQLISLTQSSLPEVVTCYKSIFSLLMKLMNYPELCKEISEDSAQKLIDRLLLLLVERRLQGYDRQEMFVRTVNILVLNCIDQLNKTYVLCALISLLYDTMSRPSAPPLYKDLIIKCLWKLNRAQPNWDSELDYKTVLLHVNIFFRDYPSSWWKKQESDAAFRTVKTILYTMVKIRGIQVQEIAKNLPEISQNSEFFLYLKKLIRHVSSASTSEVHGSPKKPTSSLSVELESPVSPKVAEDVQDQLNKISKVMEKGDTKEISNFMQKLYTLKKSHPEINFNQYLNNVSTTSKHFIEKGLADLDQLSMTKQSAAESFHTDSKAISSLAALKLNHPSSGTKEKELENDDCNSGKYFKTEAQKLWSRLQYLKEQAGLPVDGSSLEEFCDTREGKKVESLRRMELASD